METINYDARAKYYDFEYDNLDDWSFLNSLIPKDKSQKILEIPCGSGRNCRWLAETGRVVQFADLSRDMVNQVKNKIKKFAFPHQATVKSADIRNFHFNTTFDLILVTRESIQLFIMVPENRTEK